MFEVSLDGVKKFMDTTLVLKNISFQISEGEKVGIVGENGSGKTTILKLIAGIEKLNHCAGYPYAPTPLGYDEGWVNTPKDATIAYLEQIPQYEDGKNVIDVLKQAFDEVYQIEQEMHRLEDAMQNMMGTELERTLKKYSELVQLYEIKDGYKVEEKLNRVCSGLQFDEDFLNQQFNSLSGGEKTTVILGKLLIDTPDILLLDEPTNHLDMESVEWLEDYLKNYKGIVIVVSHDRYFLDHVVTKIIEIEDKESDTYKGNYSDYVRLKEEKIRIQLENFKDQRKKINTMEESVKQLREWALKADNNKFFKRAASIQIKLDKMEKIDKPTDKTNIKFNFQNATRSGKEVIKANKLTKFFENKAILDNSELNVYYGERVALIGPNGCGKTTFLKMLLGEEQPNSGIVEFGASVLMAYLPQNLQFSDEEQTVLDCFREDIYILEGKAREYLAKYMFYGGNVYKKIKHLSGGERIRLMLSKLLYQDVNLLILDEPTNHLDTTSIESIEEALSEFKGTIFFISHDRYFINKISDRVIAIEEHNFKSYLGNYDYYKKCKDSLSQEVTTALGKNEPLKKVPTKNKSAKNKEFLVSDNNKYKTMKNDTKITLMSNNLENEIKNLEKEIKHIEQKMEECGNDVDELNKLYIAKEEYEKELEIFMDKWMQFN